MAINKINKLYEMIKQLPANQKNELYERLGVIPKREKYMDGLIGIASGLKSRGSHTYKEDLYGGSGPL
ncbi:MAG TPA: hypothetical protein PK728_12595 [Bacillota bacterium]|nr:hypothetical protein [Bacillota bacterium]